MSEQRTNERGSMFLVALIALSVVTLIGLSLAMVTETEMILGSNEWAVTETHFAAEAGINVQMAQLLVSEDPAPVNFVLPSYFGRQDTRNQIGFEIKSSGANVVERGDLPYTKANFGSDSPQYTYYYALVRAQRTGWSQGKDVPDCSDTEDTILAQKFINTALYTAPVSAKMSADALFALERSGIDATYSENFFCDYETNENELTGTDLTDDETNRSGSANDILTRGNPFYYGYSGS